MPEGAGGKVEGDRDAHARVLGESKCKEARINVKSSDPAGSSLASNRYSRPEDIVDPRCSQRVARKSLGLGG